MPDELDIPLAEAVRAVRQEVLEAVRQAEGEELLFRLGTIELEFQVQITREVGANAGISLWVLSVGGSGSQSRADTHSVRLSLTPVSAATGEADVLVGSEEAERPD